MCLWLYLVLLSFLQCDWISLFFTCLPTRFFS